MIYLTLIGVLTVFVPHFGLLKILFRFYRSEFKENTDKCEIQREIACDYRLHTFGLNCCGDALLEIKKTFYIKLDIEVLKNCFEFADNIKNFYLETKDFHDIFQKKLKFNACSRRFSTKIIKIYFPTVPKNPTALSATTDDCEMKGSFLHNFFEAQTSSVNRSRSSSRKYTETPDKD